MLRSQTTAHRGKTGNCAPEEFWASLSKSEPVLRLHIGAHKTASTYIQEMLLANRGNSAACGIAYWPLSAVRPAIESLWQAERRAARSGWRARLNGDAKAMRLARKRIQNWFSTGLHVTVSEENILGHAHDSYGSYFYPEAEARLRSLFAAVPEMPIEIFLCIRAYPDFLASIYAESLRHGSFIPVDQFKATHASPGGQWTQVINAVRAAVPFAKLVVWPYESFQRLEPIILKTLSGTDYASLNKLGVANVLPSASAEAVNALADVAPSLAWQQRIFAMLALQAKFPRHENIRGFDPWFAEERNGMAAAYEDELGRIAERTDVTFLRATGLAEDRT